MSAGELMAVSACLLGRACRWNGGSRRDEALIRDLGDRALPLCPEEEGGLGTPRPRSRFQGGDGEAVWRGEARVLGEDGRDLTEPFQRGAVKALARALARGCRGAVFQEGSPSCGCRLVDIEGREQRGMGVTAALFRRAGLSPEARGCASLEAP